MEVNVDLDESFISEMAKVLKDEADHTAVVAIRNQTKTELEMWAAITTSGGFGKDDQAPDNQKPLGAGSSEIVGVLSDGAGAVGLVVYQVNKSPVYAAFYFGSPKYGAASCTARLLYQPGWGSMHSEDRSAVAKFLCSDMDNNSDTSTVDLDAMGLRIHGSCAGYPHIQVEFSVLDTGQVDTFVFGWEGHPFTITLGGTYAPTNNMVITLGNDQTAGHIPFESDKTTPDGKLYNRILRVAGHTKSFYLNFVNLSGTCKLYDESTEWQTPGADTNLWTFYSIQEKEYLWADGLDLKVTSKGSSNEPNSKFTWEKISFNDS